VIVKLSSVLKGGRLIATDKEVVEFILSTEADRRIAQSTILANQAHVIALTRAKAIKQKDSKKLLHALRRLEKRMIYQRGLEDVHVLIEEYVTRECGSETGGLLHIGKSRNDQVTTAIRLTLRDELLSLSNQLLAFERSILQLATRHTKTVFPGYTHLQPAQPITFAHYLLALCDSLIRDEERVHEAFVRVNKSPMGGGALAGTTFNINRLLVAHLLGFRGLVENSLDAVQSRDFALDALSACSMTALDLSRCAQDLITFSPANLLEMPDEFSSTSSIMPQKMNPDPLELLRAKGAIIIGNYNSSATILHALPSGYNLDFQEITPLLWQSLDSLKSCLKMLGRLVPRLKLKAASDIRKELTATTEVANILVRKESISFRVAHRSVGQAVRTALAKKVMLKDFSQVDWEQVVGRQLQSRTMRSIREALDLDKHIYAYRTLGSPNPTKCKRMIRYRMRKVELLFERNRLTQIALSRTLRKLRTIASS
jgi:argininosuccinate lyase